MKKPSPPDEDFNLWVLLLQARDTIFNARQKELHPYNISASQAAVLFSIQSIGDKATPAEISRWVFREPHSICEMLSRMEEKGLVRKVKDLGRKNLVRIMLTKKGHEVYRKSTRREFICKIMSSLSEKERQQLRSCLQTLRNKALKELGIEREIPFPPSQ